MDGVCFEWPAEEEALYFVDVFESEVVELVDGFDAFGDGAQAEVSAELDECSDQRVGLWGACERVGELAVDLDRVDRELFE